MLNWFPQTRNHREGNFPGEEKGEGADRWLQAPGPSAKHLNDRGLRLSRAGASVSAVTH